MSTPDTSPKLEENSLLPNVQAEDIRKSKINFTVFAAAVFLLNFDTGMFPLAVKLIMNDLNINHAEVAFMGTSVNAGLSFGSLLVPLLYRKFSAKTNLIACLLIHMLSLIIFGLISDYKTMVALRFISGIAAGGHLIYYPVYINNFGPKYIRATWLGFVALANPIGTTCGIIISFVFLSTVHGIFKWRLPLTVQMTAEAILLILIWRMNNEEIDVNVKSEIDTDSLIPRDIKTFLKDLKRVVSCPMVLVGTICYCFFFFSLAGIQFWSVLYMEKIYGVDKRLAVVLYLIISVCACVMGVYGGGYIVDRMVLFSLY